MPQTGAVYIVVQTAGTGPDFLASTQEGGSTERFLPSLQRCHFEVGESRPDRTPFIGPSYLTSGGRQIHAVTWSARTQTPFQSQKSSRPRA